MADPTRDAGQPAERRAVFASDTKTDSPTRRARHGITGTRGRPGGNGISESICNMVPWYRARRLRVNP